MNGASTLETMTAAAGGLHRHDRNLGSTGDLCTKKPGTFRAGLSRDGC
jgi:hypothetical protein